MNVGGLLAAANRRVEDGGGEGDLPPFLWDDFTGPAAALHNRVPDMVNAPGNLWSNLSFTFATDGSGNVPTESYGFGLIDCEAFENFAIEMEFTMGSAGSYMAVVSNGQAVDNSWEFGMYEGGTLEVYDNVGNGYHVAATFSTSLPANTFTKAKVISLPTEFQIYINDSFVGTVSKSINPVFNNATVVGFTNAFGQLITVHSFKVTTV